MNRVRRTRRWRRCLGRRRALRVRSRWSSVASLGLSVFLIALSVATAGCDAGYLSHLVLGELASLGRTMPVAEALTDPNLTQTERDKLAFVGRVRQFGIDRIGLFAGDAFTVFEAGGDGPAAWVLSASEQDRFAAYRWTFPIVGVLETKGFFDETMGRAEADALAAAGYDVFFGEAEGFSTLGFFPDPVRQANLRLDDINLAEFILHELTHSTVFKPSDIDFDEAMATFVGRAAAQAYFDETFGVGSPEAVEAAARFGDKRVIDEYVVALFDEVAAYYAAAADGGDSKETIVSGRAAVFAAAAGRYATDYAPRLSYPDRWAAVGDMPLDNARILAAVRYQGGLSDFSAVLEKTHGDFPAALAVFADAAGQEDSREYLRDWAASP